jgi:hypothetical protein
MFSCTMTKKLTEAKRKGQENQSSVRHLAHSNDCPLNDIPYVNTLTIDV